MSPEGINWREQGQADRLAAALRALPAEARLLVWSGNSRLSKAEQIVDKPVTVKGVDGRPDLTLPAHRLIPMGCRFGRTAGLEHFAIDQTVSVRFDPPRTNPWIDRAQELAAALKSLGGTAGFLVEEAPPDWPPRAGVDAVLLSLDNELS